MGQTTREICFWLFVLLAWLVVIPLLAYEGWRFYVLSHKVYALKKRRVSATTLLVWVSGVMIGVLMPLLMAEQLSIYGGRGSGSSQVYNSIWSLVLRDLFVCSYTICKHTFVWILVFKAWMVYFEIKWQIIFQSSAWQKLINPNALVAVDAMRATHRRKQNQMEREKRHAERVRQVGTPEFQQSRLTSFVMNNTRIGHALSSGSLPNMAGSSANVSSFGAAAGSSTGIKSGINTSTNLSSSLGRREMRMQRQPVQTQSPSLTPVGTDNEVTDDHTTAAAAATTAHQSTETMIDSSLDSRGGPNLSIDVDKPTVEDSGELMDDRLQLPKMQSSENSGSREISSRKGIVVSEEVTIMSSVTEMYADEKMFQEGRCCALCRSECGVCCQYTCWLLDDYIDNSSVVVWWDSLQCLSDGFFLRNKNNGIGNYHIARKWFVTACVSCIVTYTLCYELLMYRFNTGDNQRLRDKDGSDAEYGRFGHSHNEARWLNIIDTVLIMIPMTGILMIRISTPFFNDNFKLRKEMRLVVSIGMCSLVYLCVVNAPFFWRYVSITTWVVLTALFHIVVLPVISLLSTSYVIRVANLSPLGVDLIMKCIHVDILRAGPSKWRDIEYDRAVVEHELKSSRLEEIFAAKENAISKGDDPTDLGIELTCSEKFCDFRSDERKEWYIQHVPVDIEVSQDCLKYGRLLCCVPQALKSAKGPPLVKKKRRSMKPGGGHYTTQTKIYQKESDLDCDKWWCIWAYCFCECLPGRLVCFSQFTSDTDEYGFPVAIAELNRRSYIRSQPQRKTITEVMADLNNNSPVPPNNQPFTPTSKSSHFPTQSIPKFSPENNLSLGFELFANGANAEDTGADSDREDAGKLGALLTPPMNGQSGGQHLKQQMSLSHSQSFRPVIRKESVKLNQLLMHEIGFDIFMHHLFKEFSSENLIGLVELFQYHQMCGGSWLQERLGIYDFPKSIVPKSAIVADFDLTPAEKASRLCEKYILSNSDYMVNISGNTRSELEELYGSGGLFELDNKQLRDVFIAASIELYRLMQDSYARFTSTESFMKFYAKLVKGQIELNSAQINMSTAMSLFS